MAKHPTTKTRQQVRKLLRGDGVISPEAQSRLRSELRSGIVRIAKRRKAGRK